ncbi:MAG TPA: carboxypeptidase-like regulatory domain-containing protein [Terriglobales bacterium]|nr:carboxypeptidase-like regulatory domain-containing protein [Terriglobales bacterium]
MAACLDDGIEMQQNFVVAIAHGGKPLTGVAVQIKGNAKEFTVFTASDGKARITDLPPGVYWLDVEFLGIGAAYRCFHVSDRPTSRAKRRLRYEWGDEAPATRRLAGSLIDSQPNKTGTPLWNLLHPVDVPIVGANLKLQNPTTGAIYTTLSDSQGDFAFDTVPAATYVLHIEGGRVGDRSYDATDQLVELSPQASRDTLVFKRSAGGGGSCGGTSLELQSTR